MLYTTIYTNITDPDGSISLLDNQNRLPNLNTNTPVFFDHSALQLAYRLTGTDQVSLTGGFSHETQIPGAPLMLTLPSSIQYKNGALELYYNVICHEPSRVLPKNGFTWRTACDTVLQALDNLHKQTYNFNEILKIKDNYLDISCYTVAVFVLSNDRLALLRHRKLGIWLPPGGRVEREETLENAARREVSEETGLSIRLLTGNYRNLPYRQPAAVPIGMQIETRPNGSNSIDFVYISEPIGGDKLVKNEESTQLGWYGRDEIASLDLTDEMRLWCNKLLNRTISKV